MMLTLLGVAAIARLLALILFRVTSVLVALTLVPVAAGSRRWLCRTDRRVRDGRHPQRHAGRGPPRFCGRLLRRDERRRALRTVIRGSCGWSGAIRCKVALGTAAVASIAHLDGAGASTFMVTVPAMLPIYRPPGHEPARSDLHDRARRGDDEHSAVGRSDQPCCRGAAGQCVRPLLASHRADDRRDGGGVRRRMASSA